MRYPHASKEFNATSLDVMPAAFNGGRHQQSLGKALWMQLILAVQNEIALNIK